MTMKRLLHHAVKQTIASRMKNIKYKINQRTALVPKPWHLFLIYSASWCRFSEWRSHKPHSSAYRNGHISLHLWLGSKKKVIKKFYWNHHEKLQLYVLLLSSNKREYKWRGKERLAPLKGDAKRIRWRGAKTCSKTSALKMSKKSV